jgi:hypothetical protein
MKQMDNAWQMDLNAGSCVSHRYFEAGNIHLKCWFLTWLEVASFSLVNHRNRFALARGV